MPSRIPKTPAPTKPEPELRDLPMQSQAIPALKILQQGYARDYDFGRPHRTAGEFIRASNRPHWETTRDQGDTLRKNGRFLAENNPHISGYRGDLGAQVIGPHGITLDSRILRPDNNTPDKGAQQIVQDAWMEWARIGNCTADGRNSFREVQDITLKTMATDGELLIRFIPHQTNGFDFALQMMEADHLDAHLNGMAGNGNYLINGIEIEPVYWSVVAYHIRVGHPFSFHRQYAAQTERVPAQDMILIMSQERITQYRGVTWFHPVGHNINQVDRWIDAAGVAARAGASKMGFIERQETDENAEPSDQEKNADGSINQHLAPGYIEILKSGDTFKEFNPGYPDQATDPFLRSLLKINAKGLGHSYATFAGDMSDANYSSARFGALGERDFWRVNQTRLIERLCEPTFERWLPIQMLNGNVNLPFRDLARFRRHIWRARGWESVDPQKEVAAYEHMIGLGITSRRRIVAQRGGDLDEILAELAEETEKIEALGIKGPEVPDWPQEVSSNDGSSENRSDDAPALNGRSAIPAGTRRRRKRKANGRASPDPAT